MRITDRFPCESVLGLNAITHIKPQPIQKQSLHLPFLDGMRGLAALFVVICHLHDQQTQDFAKWHWQLPAWWQPWTAWMRYGIDAVSVFIVLSGFCLMLPLVRSAGVLPKGLGNFFRRRAFRIIPAYYVALALGLLLIVGKHALLHRVHVQDVSTDEFYSLSIGNVVSHLFLVHNVRYDWMQGINIPMWSVATEWQIYFIFVLLLLPIYRARGIWITILIAFCLGYAPHFLLPAVHNFDWAAPWYIGLFALGMAGAEICYSDSRRAVALCTRVRWGQLTFICCILTYGIIAIALHLRTNFALMAPLVGLTATCFIISCVGAERNGSASWFKSLFQSKPMVKLGAISYSLYLIHYLVITHIWMGLKWIHNPVLYSISLWSVGIVGSIVGASALYIACERPMMAKR